jgi:hypothetical protein
VQILIVGGGEIGFALSRELSRDHGLFVIDHNPDVKERFASLDVEFLTGSGTSADVLRRAEVEHADMLIACTGLDEVNVVSCAIANRLGVERTICFVSKDDFLGRNGSAESLREHFGIERVIWPEAQLADRGARGDRRGGLRGRAAASPGVPSRARFAAHRRSDRVAAPAARRAGRRREAERDDRDSARRHPAVGRRQDHRDGDARGDAPGAAADSGYE